MFAFQKPKINKLGTIRRERASVTLVNTTSHLGEERKLVPFRRSIIDNLRSAAAHSVSMG